MGIEIITILIVLGLLALMAIGIPLGVTTLTVSLVTAVLYFGERAGFFIVSANVTEVLHKYELIAVPFFVFMANVLERSGIAHTLFESMAILGGRFRLERKPLGEVRNVPDEGRRSSAEQMRIDDLMFDPPL